MNLVRNESILIPGGELEELSSIKNFPVFIGATEDPIETDIFSDLTFDICKTTGMIQLRNLVDPYIVYSKFHSEAVGELWEKHHSSFADLISLDSFDKTVLEIGGSDSRLALKCLDNVRSWTIMEPNIKNRIDNPKLYYSEGFFTENTKCYNYNMVVHSHVLEHSEDPITMLSVISSLLKPEDYHIFSVPNLYKYLQLKFVNTINFEHTLFLTEEFIDAILPIVGFKLLYKSYFGDHSIFYVTQKSKPQFHDHPHKYEEYKQMYLDFINYYQKFVETLNKKLEETNKTVYLFGGHVFSQYLIALGLNTSKIECILDNSQLKRNKRLYGTNLTIKLPSDVKLDNSLIILKVGQYQNEIKNQLSGLSNNIEYYE